MNPATYILSAYSSLKDLSVDQLLQIGIHHTADPNPIPSFDEEVLINLLADVQKIFMIENNILELDGDVFVVGDIHGSFHDLLRILNYTVSDQSKVLFLGDYVDRGCFSLECITLLFALKIAFPDKYYFIRGNHEFNSMCSQYGFKKEILNYHNPKKVIFHLDKSDPILFPEENHSHEKDNILHEQRCDDYFANHVNINCYKYTEKLYDACIQTFSYLPVCAIINKKTFCIHGGLTPLLDKVGLIEENIIRPIKNFEENQLFSDLLWGDPSSEMSALYQDNPRGRGKLFNVLSLFNFLKKNGLRRLIRAHECVIEGALMLFKEKCITVFSASSYNYDMGNKSGIIKISKEDDSITSQIFPPLHRLNKIDALYYRVQTFSENFQYISLKPLLSCSFLLNSKTGNNQTNSDAEMNSDNDLNPEPRKTLSLTATKAGSIIFNTGTKNRKEKRRRTMNVISKADYSTTVKNMMSMGDTEELTKDIGSNKRPNSHFGMRNNNFLNGPPPVKIRNFPKLAKKI